MNINLFKYILNILIYITLQKKKILKNTAINILNLKKLLIMK
jgi:hypothetical protein